MYENLPNEINHDHNNGRDIDSDYICIFCGN